MTLKFVYVVFANEALIKEAYESIAAAEMAIDKEVDKILERSGDRVEELILTAQIGLKEATFRIERIKVVSHEDI